MLLEASRAAVAEAFLSLVGLARQQDAYLGQLEETLVERAALRTDQRVARAIRRRRDALLALSRHLGLHPDAAELLTSLWSTDVMKARTGGLAGYSDPLPYGTRDWSGAPAAEAEVHRIMACVERFSRHSDERDAAVVLGAGTGRYAEEALGLYASVAAIERSVPMGLLFDLLGTRPLPHAEIDLNNCKSPDDFVTEVTLSRSQVTRRPKVAGASVAYAIADATRIPLVTGSQSAVLSIFFTDVIPLPALLKECRRVLKRGGLFIHYGPLDHHSPELGHKYAATEVRELLAAAGFTLLEEDWESGFHRERPDALLKRWFHCWGFVARFDAPPASRRLPEAADDALTIATTFRVDSPTTYRRDGAHPSASTVTLPDGDRLALAHEVAQLLGRIDGTRSFAQLLAELADEYEIDDATRAHLIAIVNRLVDEGLVALEPRRSA